MARKRQPVAAGSDSGAAATAGDSPPTRARETVAIDGLMQRALEVPGLLSLAAGFTDNGFLPRQEVRRIVDGILSSEAGSESLQYGVPQGRPALRRSICDYLSRCDRELGSDPGELEPRHILITNGSQQALYMAVQALCEPGDIVLVESPTYFVFLDLLGTLGVEAIAMPAASDRLDTRRLPRFFADLEASGRLKHVRAVYLVSYFSNPSGLSLERDQKTSLIEAMNEAGLCVPILEDIAYRELYFDHPWRVPTLLDSETAAISVLVMGTLTKSFSTGLKVGYALVRDDALRDRLLAIKRGQDFGTSNFTQAILERAFEDGTYDAFLAPARRHYARKCSVLHEALVESGLGSLGWTWERSAGGLYLWLTAPEHVSTGGCGEFFSACLDEKVMYVPGELCFTRGGMNKVRLSFAYLEEDLLPDAAERFVRAARRLA